MDELHRSDPAAAPVCQRPPHPRVLQALLTLAWRCIEEYVLHRRPVKVVPLAQDGADPVKRRALPLPAGTIYPLSAELLAAGVRPRGAPPLRRGC